MDMVSWFLDAGEPAYPTLLELAGDPRPLVAGTALACLGSTRDPRLVPYLNDVPWPPDDALDMRLERARTHIQLGDWNYVGILIDGLEDDRPITRAICARSLRRATNLDLGYDAYAEDEDRVEGVARWREWADARLQDAMLSPAG